MILIASMFLLIFKLMKPLELLHLRMEQQTGSKSGKDCVKTVYCHLAYLTYIQQYIMRNAELDEAQIGNQDCREKYQ